MASSAIPRVCPKCGAAVESEIGNLCPACLIRGAMGGETTLSDPPTSDPLTALAGDSFGNYNPIRVLGHGGMGVVFLAEQTGALRRQVALKVLKTDFDTRAIAQGFTREKQTLARLHHPNIVHVFDAGVSAFLRPYFVMEVVEGLPITRYADENGLTVGERVALFLQVCDALEHAHAQGILHRDLKPSNVLVALGHVKVIDFGIAKIMAGIDQGLATQRSLLTSEGRLAGTPGYMSPEQAGLLAAEVSPPSDVYSLGAILYELLAGKPALDLTRWTSGDGSGSILALLQAIRDQEPPLLSARVRDNPGLARKLKGDLEAIAAMALAKDPAHRYQTVSALAADLRGWLEHRPVSARRLDLRYRFDKWRRRNRVAATAAAVALAVGLGSLAVSAFLWKRRPSAPAALAPVSQVPYSTLDGFQQDPTFSPDGRQVAFNWNGPDQKNFDIYVSSGPGEPPHRLTTDPLDDVSPSWSPKGNEIAFVRATPGGGGRLMVIDPSNGREQELLRLLSPHGSFTTSLDWSPDGQWIVFLDRLPGDPQDGLHLLNRATGERRLLTRPSKGLEDMQPVFSAQGQIAFVRDDTVGAGVMVQKLTRDMRPEGGPEQAVYSATFPAWLPNGDLLFTSFRGGATRLWRTQSKPGGSPQLLPAFGDRIVQAVVSRDGRRLITVKRILDIDLVRYTLQADGSVRGPERFAPTNVEEYGPWVSPDGSRVAFVSYRAGGYHLWIANIDGTGIRRLSSEPGAELVRWSPDGQKIYYTSRDLGMIHRYLIDPRTGEQTPQPEFPVYSGFSPDGKWALVDRDEHRNPGIFRIAMPGPSAPHPALERLAEGFADHPMLDPDGVWVYFNRVHRGAGPLFRVRFDHTAPPEVFLPEVYAPWFLPTREGVYFTRPQAANPALHTLLFKRFAGGRILTIADLPAPLPGNRQFGGTLDGRTVLIPLQVKQGAELVLWELP